MKVVILVGGRGTRLSEETEIKPKPMVEIGGKPILWHIMKKYSYYGFNDFILCLGYKGYMIKEWFFNYYLHNSDFTVDLSNNQIKYHKSATEKWKVTLVDTGLEAGTANRLAAVKEYVGDEDFMLTYGDGVGNVDLLKLVKFHSEHEKLATVTAVKPEGRWGVLKMHNSGAVTRFTEKIEQEDGRINAGFFVLKPGIFDYLGSKDAIMMWEKAPLENLARDSQLVAYKHDGFWKPMDTLRDKHQLEELWQSGDAPWKKW